MSACKPCNHKKAGRTPSEARMALHHEPSAPRHGIYYTFFQYLGHQEEWRKFVPGWEAAAEGYA